MTQSFLHEFDKVKYCDSNCLDLVTFWCLSPISSRFYNGVVLDSGLKNSEFLLSENSKI